MMPIGAKKIVMAKNRTGDLYRLDFHNGKSYIGASTGYAEARYKTHKYMAKIGSLFPLHKAWREFGDPELIVLKRGLPSDKLWSEEKKAIIKYNTKAPNGYNYYNGSDSAPGMLGKITSKITREKQSQAMTGKPFSEEHKENLRLASQKRWKKPEEHEKSRQSHLGKRLSEKTKNKIRIANLGTKRSEKTKEKLRTACRKRWDDPNEHKKQSLISYKREEAKRSKKKKGKST